MLKKIGLLASSAIGLTLLAAPFASADTGAKGDFPDQPTYGDAVNLFTDGGAALGYGAAALVGGAYTGIALTPELVLDSITDDASDVSIPLIGN